MERVIYNLAKNTMASMLILKELDMKIWVVSAY